MPGFFDDMADELAANLARGIIDGITGNRETICANCRRVRIRYNVKRNGNGPFYCLKCMEQLIAPYRSPFETTDLSYVMPGLSESLQELGCTEGKYRLTNNNGRLLVHCDVFEGRGQKNAMHLGYDFDPMTGNVVGEVHQHHDSADW